MTRLQIHDQFVARFGGSVAFAHYSEEDLRAAEQHLGIFLPESYRAFMVTHGAISSESLLGVIVDTGAELRDLMSFIPAPEINEVSRSSWSAGMRSELIAFAIDCRGSFFCFSRSDLLGEQPDDAPIWFFDHDYCTDEQIAGSFDLWLTAYLSLPDADPDPRAA